MNESFGREFDSAKEREQRNDGRIFDSRRLKLLLAMLYRPAIALGIGRNMRILSSIHQRKPTTKDWES